MTQEKTSYDNGNNGFDAARVCCKTNERAKPILQDVFKQRGENEDENIRKSLIKFLININNGSYTERIITALIKVLINADNDAFTKSELKIASWIAWLEKLGGNKSEEYIFSPMTGYTIDEAAKQAVDKVANGENIVISFNGFYMKIYKETTSDDIINSYNDFCKKQCEKNSKWSYEDKKNIETTISFLKDFADKGYENAVACIDWLKYLEQRMEEQI